MAATTALNASLLAPSLAAAREGMLMPRPYDLAAGTVVYRFVDTTRRVNPRDAVDGAWWFEYEAFQQIKHFGLGHGYSLDYSARLHAAILYEWSEVTRDLPGRHRAYFLECRVGEAHVGDPRRAGSRRLVLKVDSLQVKRLFFTDGHYRAGTWAEIDLG